ncbi:hypothetical protein BT69DRAFT_1336374 [Atractiella rhizophila]|nr:hypothetical protein BT69DRAFT_1336374 [Atractiella rhizophila]
MANDSTQILDEPGKDVLDPTPLDPLLGGAAVASPPPEIPCDECKLQNKPCRSVEGICELCASYNQACTAESVDPAAADVGPPAEAEAEIAPSSLKGTNTRCVHCKNFGAKCKPNDPANPNGQCRRCTQQKLECLRAPKDGRYYRWHPDANAIPQESLESGGKRIRSSVACTHCKTAKRKCEMVPEQGACTNCLRTGAECVVAPTFGRWKRWHPGSPPPGAKRVRNGEAVANSPDVVMALASVLGTGPGSETEGNASNSNHYPDFEASHLHPSGVEAETEGVSLPRADEKPVHAAQQESQEDPKNHDEEDFSFVYQRQSYTQPELHPQPQHSAAQGDNVPMKSPHPPPTQVSFVNYTANLAMGKPMFRSISAGAKNAYSTNCDYCKRRKKKCDRSPELNGGCEGCRKAGLVCITTPKTTRKQLVAQMQKREVAPQQMPMAPDPEEVDVSNVPIQDDLDIPVDPIFSASLAMTSAE